jgi:hypothetical protein
MDWFVLLAPLLLLPIVGIFAASGCVALQRTVSSLSRQTLRELPIPQRMLCQRHRRRQVPHDREALACVSTRDHGLRRSARVTRRTCVRHWRNSELGQES